MSPTEAQLRAALREGEGDGVDAGVLIANANRARRSHRHRINTGLGIAAAVALLGVPGIAAITAGNQDQAGGGSSAGGSSDYGAAASRAVQGRAAGNSHGKASAPPASAPGALGLAPLLRRCPAAPDELALPGGGGIGKFGSSDPLFTGQVATITACGYPPSGKRARTVIVGTALRTTVRGLEAAPSTALGRPQRGCAARAGGVVELLPVDSRGRNLRPVVVTLGCPPKATNGTAVRYPASLPAPVAAVLRSKPR